MSNNSNRQSDINIFLPIIEQQNYSITSGTDFVVLKNVKM